MKNTSKYETNEVDPQRMSADQAAAYLNVSGGFVRTMAKQGRIRHQRIGSRYFFNQIDLDTLLAPIEPHNANTSFIE